MKLHILLPVLILVLAASLLSACSLGASQTPEPTPMPAVPQEDLISAEAYVVPRQQADLAFEDPGQLAQLPVQAGDMVKVGDLLAGLDSSTQQAQLAQSQAALQEAQAQLDRVNAGPIEEQIAQAEAEMAKAEASLAETLAGPSPQEVAQAQAAVETARANLLQVQAGFRDEDVAAASARVLQAEADLRLAQADYDKNVFGDPDVAEPYGVALQQATLEYERAQAEYNKLANGATYEEIAVAQAQLNEAQAALARVQAGPTAEQAAQARAELSRAEAALAEIRAGASMEEISVAEAGVEGAQANLLLSQTELSKTLLAAPFDGTVGLVHGHQGEYVQPGQPVLSLGSDQQWQIETDDLNEMHVVKVEPGSPVTISVDALPDQLFEGVVTRVAPKAETKAGDQTYTALIDITRGDTSQLRWGMTCMVDIDNEDLPGSEQAQALPAAE